MSTPQEELLKAIAGAGAKSKASLMSGINSAGQQYFQAPYNIPSTFGNYYVGSPTAAVSDFVPLPLDFLESKLGDIQEKYDLAQTAIKSEPGELNKLIPLAPYHEDKRGLIIGDTLKEIEELSRAVLRDPTQSSRVAAKLAELRSNIQQNPLYNQYAVTGYKDWTDRVQPAMEEKGFETGIIGQGFYDPATGQYRQISAVAPEIILNDWQKFFNDNLKPNFTASMTSKLDSVGLELDPTGVLVDKQTKTKITGIDPRNQYYGKFYNEAIDDVANLIVAGKGDNFRIAREVEGLGKFEDAREYVKRMVSGQFYEQELDEELDKVVKSGTGGGGGKGAVTEEVPFVTTTVPQEKVTESGFKTYTDLKTNVINNTQVTKDNQAITRTPYRTVQEASEALNLSPSYFVNTKDGMVVKSPDGTPFILKNEPIKEDILGRNSEWGPLNLSGSVDYSFVKNGNDLIPTISNLTIKEPNGNILSEDDPLYKSIRAAVVTKNTNDIAAKKDLEYIENETAKKELALFKKKDGATLNKVALNYVNPKYVRQDVEDPVKKDVRVQYVDRKTGEIKTSEQVQKETSNWLGNLSDSQLLTIFKNNPNEKIANEVTKKYAVSPNASTRIISFSQPGKQRTAESTSDLSRVESDLVETWGYYDENGQYKGNREFLDNALRQAIIINDDGTTTTLAKKGIASKKDYEKFKTFINYGGIGFSNGKPYYYGALQFNEPDPDWSGDVRYLNGARVKIPISALPEIGKRFVEALSVSKAGQAYATVISNAMASGKSGVLLDVDKDTPWVKGATSITWNRPTYASEGQGGAVYVDVTFAEPQKVPNSDVPVKSYRIRAADALDAGLQLHDLNAYYLYQDAFNNYQGGTGGSSTGMGKPIK